MHVRLPKGKYIVAVSGGVDSMCLLDILRQQSDISLVVAHVNHGLRDDAIEDEKLVLSFAMSHNILCETTRLNLSKTNEEAARHARYAFLRQLRNKHAADAIVTAHHEDDLIETAIINIIRGTGWRGLAPFVEQSDILRPLLHISKKELIAYAQGYQVPWREDSTNASMLFLRNRIRHVVMPKLNSEKSRRSKFLRLIRTQQQLRRTINDEANEWLKKNVNVDGRTVIVPRHLFIMLPTTTGYELLQFLLQTYAKGTVQRRLAENLLLFIKVAKPGKYFTLNRTISVHVTTQTFIVELHAT